MPIEYESKTRRWKLEKQGREWVKVYIPIEDWDKEVKPWSPGSMGVWVEGKGYVWKY